MEILINMNELSEFLHYEEEWRKKELSILLKMVNTQKNENYRDILLKYSIPAVYAIWEGFLRESLKHYSSFLNRKTKFEKNMNLITQIVEHNRLFKGKQLYRFNVMKELLDDIKTIFDYPIIPEERPFTTNLHFNKTNLLLNRFNLKPLERKYRLKLDKLVKTRQSIAHGEKPVNYTVNEISEHISLVENLIDYVLLIIEEKSEYIENNS